ncbi:MAG: bacterial Ig-like domain-containing protein, partial [Bacilli bacterium]|nr:bacterial Ig-like domain-containing protein [Bacilli bacterium]
ITITVAGVRGIEVDTSEAKTAFLLNSAFDTAGLKLKATMDNGEEVEITNGFSVTAPDLTTAGSKSVEVSYGNKTITYNITVGELVRGGVVLSEKGGKAILTIDGTYSGFNSVAELTAAAKGTYFFDLQYNASYSTAAPGWDRNLKNGEIAYADNGEGKFAFEVDVSSLLAAGGKGVGYTMHFNTLNTSGQDVGEPGDWKVKQSVDQEIVLGSRKYKLVGYPDSESGSEFWGNYGLIIIDDTTAAMNVTDIDLSVADDKAYATVKGAFSHVDVSDLNGKILCDIQELYAWTEIGNLAVAELTTNVSDAANNVGTFTIKFDITGKLQGQNPYFFHFHFDEGGNPTSNEHNVNWDAKTMTTKNIVDPANGNTIKFQKSTTTDWSSNLAVLMVESKDFVKATSVSLAQSEDKALLTLAGKYHGITTNENNDYRFSVQAFDSWELVVGGDTGVEADLALTPSAGDAEGGTFALTVDLAGKLESGKTYFAHFGPGDGDGPNLGSFTGSESASFRLGGGVYNLGIYSGATAEGDTWRNGLITLSYVAD